MNSTCSLDTLPNGLRVATAEMPHMASVSVGLWAGVGSRHETASQNGAAHFIEHLLFKGTPRRTARRISGEVEALGGTLEAFTAEDHSCYYAKAEARHFSALVDVLADMFSHSRFAAREVERERGVIREEIQMYADQPAQAAEELLAAAMWPAHPLGRPLAGTIRTVKALRRAELIDFWRAGYTAGSSVLTVAGNVHRQEVLKTLTPLMRNLPAGTAPPCKAWIEPAGQPPRVVIERRDDEQVQLILGYTAPGRHEASRFAARVLNAVLGEKADSRLFQSLRERRGLCYSVVSELSVYAETGLLSISLGLDDKNLRRALRLIQKEIAALCDILVGKRELREARDYLAGQHALAMESTVNQMMWLGESILAHGRLIDPGELRAQLLAVTSQHVRHAAQAILRDGFRALVAVGPVSAREAELL